MQSDISKHVNHNKSYIDQNDAPGENTTGSVNDIVSKYSIASGYELTEDLPLAFAYVCTTGHDGNQSAATPTFSLSGYGGTKIVFSNSYARSGYNVKIAIYRITNAKRGSVIKGSSGILFY